jgi:hypothetical protein
MSRVRCQNVLYSIHPDEESGVTRAFNVKRNGKTKERQNISPYSKIP